MTATLGTFEPRAKAEPTGQGDREIVDLLSKVVYDFEAANPRSQQRSIGLSEIGHPCPRRIAYKLAGMPRPEKAFDDPWLMILGTAFDAWLMQALAHANGLLGRERFITQRRVFLRPDKPGSLDIYDVDRFQVIDAKLVGKSSREKAKKKPRKEYRTQVHCYGQGMVNAGYRVDRVAIAYFPRDTYLSKAFHVWSEDFDPRVPAAALERADTINQLTNALRPVLDPVQFTRFPKVTGYDCMWCPFYRPGADTGATCPGNDEE